MRSVSASIASVIRELGLARVKVVLVIISQARISFLLDALQSEIEFVTASTLACVRAQRSHSVNSFV